MARKVMVLGAGLGQLPLLQTLRRYGFYVIVVAPQRANSPCFELADKFYYSDVKDKNLILDIARKEKVVAVLSDQLDLATQSCGYAAENLGLIGNSYRSALLFSNKQLMHEFASKKGIKVAKNCKTDKLFDALEFIKHIKYPAVIKPVDSDASRGVYKICSDDELTEHFEDARKFSSDGTVLVEEFIEGQEYVVDGFAWDGKYQTLAIGKCFNFNIRGKCISKQRIFKSVALELSDVEKRIIKINQEIVRSFSPKIASTQGEYIYDHHRNEIYFNEIAARGGGCFVSSHLVPYASGIDVNDLLVKYISGQLHQQAINLKAGYSAYTCFLLPPGIIKSIEGIDSIKSLSSVKDIFISNIKEGMVTSEIRDKSSRYGPFIMASNSLENILDDIKNIKDNFKIFIQSDDIVKGIIWE
ncbi:MAG: ATP-grasp domain-containing protein [Proteobacteria bacterium]|nr:ATP-grasp domain-containing protein [Pseudomonadota bacterium]